MGLANGKRPDTITGYALSATQAESDRIPICRGTAVAPTHSGADSGSDHVITVVQGDSTIAVITRVGITTGSTNFPNLNVAVSDDGPNCG